jgi:hypothetical protein
LTASSTDIKNLDQGMFYAFTIMSLYFIKTAYFEFNSCVNEALESKKYVDKNTQTYTEEDLTASDHQYEHVIEEISVAKRKFLGFW